MKILQQKHYHTHAQTTIYLKYGFSHLYHPKLGQKSPQLPENILDIPNNIGFGYEKLGFQEDPNT
jgi:hypothetical protein